MPYRADMWVTIGTAAPVVATATAISVGAASGRMRDALPGLKSLFDSELASLNADVSAYGEALEKVRADSEALEARALAISRELTTTRNDRQRARLDAEFQEVKRRILELPKRNAAARAIRPDVERRNSALAMRLAYARMLSRIARWSDLVAVAAFLSCGVATLLSVISLSTQSDIAPRAMGVVFLGVPLFGLLTTPIVQFLIDMNRFAREELVDVAATQSSRSLDHS